LDSLVLLLLFLPVRFVNGLEGASIDIHSTELDTIHLEYMQASTYTGIAAGQIHVTNVVDSNTGNSYTNGEPLLITFNFDATVAVVSNGATAVLALFNETNAVSSDTSKSWIRVIDLATSSEFVNFATVEGSFAAYVGPMVVTKCQAVSASDNELRVYDSATGSYNSPMVSLPIAMTAGNAYTAFYFTPSSGPAATFFLDHPFSNGGSTPVPTPNPTSTSGSPNDSTSGSPNDSTSSSSASPSTSSSSQPQQHQNSASQVGIFVLLSIVASILAF